MSGLLPPHPACPERGCPQLQQGRYDDPAKKASHLLSTNSASRRTQAWIETLFGHVKGEHPHLELIKDPAELEAELDHVRGHYNTVRLHAGIGYVTTDDEHEGRGEGIRQARRLGLEQARQTRIQYRRNQKAETP